jgi:hypothetical protein
MNSKEKPTEWKVGYKVWYIRKEMKYNVANIEVADLGGHVV